MEYKIKIREKRIESIFLIGLQKIEMICFSLPISIKRQDKMEYTQPEINELLTEGKLDFLMEQCGSLSQKMLGAGMGATGVCACVKSYQEQWLKLHKICQGHEVIMKQFTYHKWGERQAAKNVTLSTKN